MASNTSKFQVGIFVLAAGAMVVVALIWLGATQFFTDSETFVTYFSESVQGLDPGSAVKFRGVPAGRVGDIHIAPDGNLIEVVLDIDTSAAHVIKNDERFRAKLELTGITGLRYIEIERREGDELRQAPLLNFEPAYPVIPSAQSRFQAIQVALAEVYDRVMQVDLGAITSDARNALQSADSTFDEARVLLRDPRIGTVLDNLTQASASAARTTQQLEKTTADLQVKPLIDNADNAAREARQLFASLNKVSTQQIAGAAHDFAALMQIAQQAVADLRFSIDRLDRTASSLRGLAEEVRSQPSLLLFSEPPRPRGEERKEERR